MKQVVQSPMAIGRALRDARRAQALTQAALAERAGMRQPTVSNLERGRGGMALGTLLRLLAALRLELVLQDRTHASPADPWTDAN